ncbi:ABC transporter permease [Pedobacter sp. N36a]|uniref:ABC transporter permease n=1 Tax=Pedobacter sp. N36a TaxID=2767996 RepID=UPI001656AF37|nr:ABC transporter permease [Pedobacter sp. N36a]MBC8987925.1 ABC transporter permease [Pedobacter sp. N36a]
MFRLNLKIAMRNLWKTKGYTLLNIFGLSIGLAGFIIILLYANLERSYDTWNPEAKNVYRVSIKGGPDQDEYASSPAELAPALKEVIPEIEDYGRYYVWDSYQRLLTAGSREMYVDHILGVDSNWFNLFPYKFIYGDAKSSILSNNQIVLSQPVSEKFFGKTNPVGQSLVVNADKRYTVSGVYELPNTPEHIEVEGFIKKSSKGDGWGNGNFYTYLKAKPGTDGKILSQKLNAAFQKLPMVRKDTNMQKVQLITLPVTDVYLHATSLQDPVKRGNPAMVTILVLFSSLLLIIACINFTNLAIAQSVKRAKETGIRKVLGAAKRHLISYFLTETTIQCLVALLLALVFAEVALPVMNRLMDLNLSLLTYSNPWRLGLQLGSVMLLVIVLSGGYAAFFLSSYEPVKVLKGNFSRGNGSMWMRKALISVQFIVAIVFIVSLMIIKQQVNYIKNQDVGFKKDHVLVFKIRKGETRSNFQQVKDRLLKIDGVTGVSRVNYYPGVKAIQVIGREFNGQYVDNLSVVTTDFDYFDVMGMPAIAGRLISSKFKTDSTAVMVNEASVKKYGLKELIGKKWINDQVIVGVLKDHVQRGMEFAAEPTVFMVETKNSNAADQVVVKVNGKHTQETINGIKNIWQSVEPFPFQYTWLDQSFANVYMQYIRLDKIFNVFTYVTLALAILGLFALASFTVQERTKEIGVRKVLGAETSDILKMINSTFLILVLVANLIAIPIAYILASTWLSGFAYRSTITIWPFLAATFVSVLVTVLTVSLQTYKTANAKPVDALKYE